jgi:hypothetical protein
MKSKWKKIKGYLATDGNKKGCSKSEQPSKYMIIFYLTITRAISNTLFE